MRNFIKILLFSFFITGCEKPTNIDFWSNQSQNPPSPILKVGIMYNPLVYIVTGQEDRGFDYELLIKFAAFYDKQIQFFPYSDLTQIYKDLDEGKLDLIATGTVATTDSYAKFRPGPTLYTVDQLVVYNKNSKRIDSLSDLDQPITVMTGSLDNLKALYPNLKLEETQEYDTEELLEAVNNSDKVYTITNSIILKVTKQFYPELIAGPILTNKQSIAWLLPKNNSAILMSKLLEFWDIELRKGTFAALTDKYFSYVEEFNYVETKYFLRAINEKLPLYKKWFQKYSNEIDWRVLAAAGYQESHWEPLATSVTGVRGLMMLTNNTAKDLGITDRLDPEQSIMGGGMYLSKLFDLIPESIPENEKLWFVLGSYNIGLGHILDARALASNLGLNPDAWHDLKLVLPLLHQKKYYSQTKYGMARGKEAVQYVDNIRRYFATLVKFDEQSITQKKE